MKDLKNNNYDSTPTISPVSSYNSVSSLDTEFDNLKVLDETFKDSNLNVKLKRCQSFDTFPTNKLLVGPFFFGTFLKRSFTNPDF